MTRAEAPAGLARQHSRLEDADLLTGRACYVADVDAPGALHAVFVRSPLAHARIAGIDTSAAAACRGVAAVLTAQDLDVPAVPFVPFSDQLHPAFHRRPLTERVVRFAGEVVAVVVAGSEREAADAAWLVRVSYQPLPPVTDPAAALRDDILLFPAAGTNVALRSVLDAGLPGPGSAHQVTVRVRAQRLSAAPMEAKAALAVYCGGGQLDMWVSMQMPHAFRDITAKLLGIPSGALRVRCPAVGGSFGGKTPFDPDYVLVACLARELRATVRWRQSRAENLQTMQGRDQRFEVRLSCDDAGRFCDLDVQVLANVGAYPGIGIGMVHTSRLLATGPYRIPHVRHEIRCVATTTPPVGAFRGAGRPEATHALERAVDALAARTGRDPAELRARNLIGADEFPYTTATGCTYDSGRYERALRVAMDAAGYPDLRREQLKRRQSGDDSLVGIGISCYVEVSAAQPGFDREYAAAEIHPSGRVTITAGTSAHGQGHWTVYAGLAAAILGVTPLDVDLVQSDTARVPEGAGTGGSRSAQVGGSAVRGACLALVEQARSLAAGLLGRATGLAVLPGGGIGGAAGRLSWAELAAAARRQGSTLRAEYRFAQDGGTAPFGTHIAVVEVDRRTGAVTLRRMVAVDDCGTVLDPVLAEGQVHGGLAAGIAQVLFEEAGYDAAGRPLNGSFASYRMPSAADLPRFEVQHTVTPSPKNPLGAKGLGESGTTGSVAAVHNAVLDALAPLGVTELDPPFLPGRVWAAIEAAGHAPRTG